MSTQAPPETVPFVIGDEQAEEPVVLAPTDEPTDEPPCDPNAWQDWTLDELGLDGETIEAVMAGDGPDTAGKLYEFLVASPETDTLNGVACPPLRGKFDDLFAEHPDWRPDVNIELSAEGPAKSEESVIQKLKLRDEHLQIIQDKRAEVVELLQDWSVKQEAAKSAKKLYEAECEVLLDMIDEENSPQPKLPGCSTIELEDQDPEGEAPSEDDESWKLATLEQIGFPESICVILREKQEGPLNTMGDIQEWCTNYGLGDLKKIGPEKQKVMEDCMAGFWEKWNHGEFTAPDEAPTEAEDEADAKPSVVQLTCDIDGYDNEEHQLYAGAEFDVVGWDHTLENSPQVTTADGSTLVFIEPDQYIPTK